MRPPGPVPVPEAHRKPNRGRRRRARAHGRIGGRRAGLLRFLPGRHGEHLGRFRLGGGQDRLRLDATQLGQERLGVFAGRLIGVAEGFLIERADPLRLLPIGERILMGQDNQGETPRPPFPHILAAPQNLAERRLRRRVLFLGGNGEPIDGEPHILLDAGPIHIEAGEPVLRLGITEIARGVTEQVHGIRRVGRKRPGRNAVEIVLAKGNESFGGIFRDRTRWADIGLLVGDLLEIGKGLGVVLRHLPARGVGARELDLSPQHAAQGGIFERGQRSRGAARLQCLHALAIGLGGRSVRRRIVGPDRHGDHRQQGRKRPQRQPVTHQHSTRLPHYRRDGSRPRYAPAQPRSHISTRRRW